MAALPYMRLYCADYDADTAHLSTLQDGIYFRLIRNYWQRGGPLPDDDVRLARIAGVNMREWKRNRDVIREFFTVQDNLWHHSRLQRELSCVEAKSLNNKRPGNTNAKRSQRDGDANETRSSIYTEADTEAEKEEERSMPDKSGDYAVFGKTVKLAPRHFNEWRRLFSTIPDLKAELSIIDDWWEKQPKASRENWFLATKGMLNKRHQENVTNRRDYDPERITV